MRKMGANTGATWRIQLNDQCMAAMQPHVTVIFCYYHYEMCRPRRVLQQQQQVPVCWAGAEREAACCRTLHLVGW